MRKALLFWSSGKDSAYTLHLLRTEPDVEVVGLLTTVNRPRRRVAVHAVREKLLTAQAQACGLPLKRVPIPDPCPKEKYEAAIREALEEAKRRGITAVASGDLFLEDSRRYREEVVRRIGMEPVFPLWGRDTHALASEMVQTGLRARVTCVNTKALPRSFVGRVYDQRFLSDLPSGVDPCGENDEFHTFTYAGPVFREAIPVNVGKISERDGFVYADIIQE
ncbi:MAG: ATP-binding protein [Acidiferrobacterales bacterium]